MKKYIVLFFIGISGLLPLRAQHFTTSFFQPLTWEQASLTAARENKLVLVEVGPIEWNLEKKLEKHREVSNFLRRNVVAIRMDLSTPSGKEFEVRLLMHAYPVFAFFMPYGDLVGVVSPGEVAENVEILREVLQEAQQMAEVKKRNSRSVAFTPSDLKQALEIGAKEDKNLFVYVRDARSQPSLLMEKNVLNLDRVADFYNQHFVSLSLNREQADELLQKYPGSRLPAYLFLNANGKLLFRAEGYSGAEQFIGYGKAALEKAKGIPFEKFSAPEAQAKAAQTGKLIFTDHYVGGNAHKELVRTIFTDPEVTDLFTAQFVNVGKEGEQAFLQFTDAAGKELHRVISVRDAEDLLKQAQKALTGQGIGGLAEEYRQGNRKAGFLEEYIEVLDRAGQTGTASQVAMEYLAPLSPECLKEKRYWELFERYVRNAAPLFFDYILKQKAQLAGLYGEEKVNQKLTALWIAGAENFVSDGRFDEAGFKDYTRRLRKEKVEGWRQIVRNARMHAAEQLGDWKTFITLAEEKWNEEKLTDAELYRWGMQIDASCKDEGLRYKMALWLADRAQEIKRQEQISGKVKVASYRGFFEKLVDDLLKNQ